jgi:hypothetical protein
MSIIKRILLVVVALASFAVTQQLSAQSTCPPNGWYCPVIPENCNLVGCARACSVDCPFVCKSDSRTRGNCPPLEACEPCTPK